MLLIKAFPRVRKILNPTSLRGRLTVGIAAVSLLGLSGVVTWTSWQMQRILVVTHKNNTSYIADRFGPDADRAVYHRCRGRGTAGHCVGDVTGWKFLGVWIPSGRHGAPVAGT